MDTINNTEVKNTATTAATEAKKTKKANAIESYGVDAKYGKLKVLEHGMYNRLKERHDKMFEDISTMTLDEVTDQNLSFILGVSSGTIAQQRNGRAYKDGHKLTAWQVIYNALTEKKETAAEKAERIKAEAKAEAEKAAHAATIAQIKTALAKGLDTATLMMCGFNETDISEAQNA